LIGAFVHAKLEWGRSNMSITALVAAQLPLLRRYARALTGSQTSGDFYVLAMLETLVADPSVFDRSLDPRVATYRLFSHLWNSVTLNEESDILAAASPADRHVRAITPLPRQAFLLTAVEGFSIDPAAEILSATPEEVSTLIDAAGREIGAQVSSTVLVIEDEPIIAMDLEALVTNLGHKVVGNARTHAEAVTLAKAARPGLVLADVRLADGSSGLAAVNEILETFEVPVIFITAYPESLLTGQCPEPTFLIAKPFREDTVKAVVSQALFFGEVATARRFRIA
jgi:CheY-like chemotaxis protein/DNA-directed RNA polymerase specialized sigma24 family protein